VEIDSSSSSSLFLKSWLQGHWIDFAALSEAAATAVGNDYSSSSGIDY